MSWKLHLPLIKVVAATALSYLAALAIHFGSGHALALSWAALLYFLAGGFYTHLFEYFYHKLAMHRTIRFGRFTFVDQRHREHHRIFQGNNFQTRNLGDLKEVTTQWYTFPALFLMHYFLFLLLFPARWAVPFFLGVACQFLWFETSHWFTHVEDSAFDKALGRLPLLGRTRALQIKHHQTHHATPMVNFNFTPPYVGDRMGGTLSK